MIVDSSAIIAILREEPEVDTFIECIAHAPYVRISAVNYVESAMVLIARDGEKGDVRFEEWFATSGIEIHPVNSALAQAAKNAFKLFGKGRHPARLNFGDCFAYALAKHLDEPLLFKGDDFSKTDVTSAL